jgi:NAD(P)-dependent dehydrogenase (short-subunit alcohol dehydrogenase family)
MFELKNKVALVTGARRGIGKGIALALARVGAKAVVTDIDQKECQTVVEEIEKMGGQGLALKVDVIKKEEIVAAVEETIKKFGRLDILINNAGICSPIKPLAELTENEWDRLIDVNLKGYFLCAQAVVKEMAKQKWGRIVNIASVASGGQGFGLPNISHYVASKGGVIGLTESWAVEFAPLGINVNAICPGIIETPMVDPFISDPQVKQGFLARVPKRRLGQPEDIGAAAVFLASEEADYVTGAALVVDGGWLAA